MTKHGIPTVDNSQSSTEPDGWVKLHQKLLNWPHDERISDDAWEDAIQEVFLKLQTKELSEILGDLGDPASYIARMVRNIAVDAYRTRRAAARAERQFAADRIHAQCVIDELIGEEDSQQIREALLKVPTQQRIVLELFYMEELKCREIAKRLGVTVAVVTKRLSRGRNRLRTLLLQ